MSIAEPIDPAPDWSAASTPELCCPLCEYNLRGLDQPRCPECGFAFSWSELLRGLRDVHPYLFEHQPKRNIWSFWKTYWRDCLPRRFWKQLSPAHPVRMGRLIVYWLIANLALIVSCLVPLGWNLWVVCRTPPGPVFTWSVVYSTTGPSVGFNPFTPNSIRSMRFPPGYPRPSLPPGAPVPTLVRTATTAPPQTFLRSLETALDITGRQLGRTSLPAAMLIVLAWPWATLAALLVFSQSMRRAKIRKRHVLRTVIYGTDFGLIIICLLILQSAGRADVAWPMFIAFACAVITLYRVYFAYSNYLRFHMPFATVLASQIIAFLAILTVYVQE